MSIPRVLAMMTMEVSVDAAEAEFKIYISRCLVPRLWMGAGVMTDSLPAHKVDAIEPLFESVGAKGLDLSLYSPNATKAKSPDFESSAC
jgi:hypothetical protein